MTQAVTGARLNLYVLGALRVEWSADTRVLHLPTRKVESLFAYLALRPGQHSREKLAGLLWGDSPDEQARGSLRKALTLMRGQLGEDLLLADREAVQLNPAYPLWVDARAFESEARTFLAEPGSQRREGAIGLYRGELLANFYDDWITRPREELHDLFVRCCVRAMQAAKAQGDYEQAIELAQGLLRHDPANEDAFRHLMMSYAATGRHEAALEEFARCRRALATELDVEPSPETQALLEQIKRQRAMPAGRGTPGNLPAPLTSFIGRQEEIAQVKMLLPSARLVTLTGPGGCGKTRLAIRIAGDLVDNYPDGVWWVELAAQAEDGLVPVTCAAALGLQEIPGQPTVDTLITYLKPRRLILVLDNCEHVVGACAQLCERLLTTCPRVSILTTSREPLGIGGEALCRVPPLALPDPGELPGVTALAEYESVRLFTERARSVAPHFSLNGQNAAAVAHICRALDGMPLAIELAAARTGMLAPVQIVERLGQRFELLTGGSRTAQPRQQTLRAAIDWSYDLLDEPERKLLRWLSVFAGGFSLEAAETLASGRDPKSVGGESELQDGERGPATLEVLARLIDKSLVAVEAQRDGGHGIPRYRLLESIREYAGERLAEEREAPTARRRHMALFCELAERCEGALLGHGQVAASATLEREHENLVAAMTFALDADPVSALRLIDALGYFWTRHAAASEGRRWLEEALARAEALPGFAEDEQITAGRGRAYSWLGQTYMVSGDNTTAQRWLQRGLELAVTAGDGRAQGVAASILGVAELLSGNLEAAGRRMQESVASLRAVGDKPVLVMALSTLARYWSNMGDQAGARACAEEAILLADESGNRWGAGMAHLTLAWVAKQDQAYRQAQEHALAGLAIFNEMGDRHFANVVTSALADLALLTGDWPRASQHYRQVMLAWRDLGNVGGIARCLECLAFVAAAARGAGPNGAVPAAPNAAGDRVRAFGDPELCRSVRLLSAAAGVRAAHRAPMAAYEQDQYSRYLSGLQASLAGPVFAAEWQAGQALTQDEAMALALQDR